MNGLVVVSHGWVGLRGRGSVWRVPCNSGTEVDDLLAGVVDVSGLSAEETALQGDQSSFHALDSVKDVVDHVFFSTVRVMNGSVERDGWLMV